MKERTIRMCVETSEINKLEPCKLKIETFLEGIPGHKILGILHAGKPWQFVSATIMTDPPKNDFREESILGTIKINIQGEKNRLYKCPNCGNMCKAHEYESREHTHVKILNYQTVICSKIPKLHCEKCGKWLQIPVPWARPRVSFCVELEKEVLRLLDDMPATSVADTLGIGAWVVADIVNYRVSEALKDLDLSDVILIYVDETSFKKGHEYVTVVCDQNKRIIFMCYGRDSKTMDSLREWIIAHKGNPDAIKVVSCDMGLPYTTGCKRNFPNAAIVYDKFHVTKMVYEAFEKTRKRLAKRDPFFEKLGFLIYKHEKDLTQRQQATYEVMKYSYAEMAENYRMKELFSEIYLRPDKENADLFLKLWQETVMKNCSEEMQKAAEHIIEKKENILSWFDNRVNNGFAEGLNSLIQTTKRIARGFRNVDNFIGFCFLRHGKLAISF